MPRCDPPKRKQKGEKKSGALWLFTAGPPLGPLSGLPFPTLPGLQAIENIYFVPISSGALLMVHPGSRLKARWSQPLPLRWDLP